MSKTKLDEKGMEKFQILLGMPHMVVKKCEGRSGGLALFWKKEIDVSLRWMGRMHIDATIKESYGLKWRMIGIYGEPRTNQREETWRVMRTLHHQSNLSWIVFGDFKEILCSH